MFLAEFMSCILFIGYLMIGMYGLILITLPCLFLMLRSAEREQMAQHLVPRNQVQNIISSLSRVAYDPENFKHENTCAICLGNYITSDMVT